MEISDLINLCIYGRFARDDSVMRIVALSNWAYSELSKSSQNEKQRKVERLVEGGSVLLAMWTVRRLLLLEAEAPLSMS